MSLFGHNGDMHLNDLIKSVTGFDSEQQSGEVRYNLTVKVIQKILTEGRSAVERTRASLCTLLSYLFRKVPCWKSVDLHSVVWRNSLSKFSSKYYWLWMNGLSTTWLKYHTACIFSLCEGQELPNPLDPLHWNEKPGYFLSGIGAVFLKIFIERGHQPGLGWNFVQSKKGMGCVHPLELVLARAALPGTLSKVRKPLISTQGPTPKILVPQSWLVDYVSLSPEDLKDLLRGSYLTDPRYFLKEYSSYSGEDRTRLLAEQVVRTSRELFQGHRYVHKPVLPSLASHFEAGRSSGGALAIIGDEFRTYYQKFCDQYQHAVYSSQFGCDHNFRSESLDPFCGAEYWNGHYCEVSEVLYIDWLGKNVQVRKFQYDSDDWIVQTRSRFLDCFLSFEMMLREELSRRPNIDVDEVICVYLNIVHNCVIPVSLPEPLKVRMITRGPALRYWLARYIQKFTHGVLKSHPVFFAIGRPIQDEDLERVLLPLGEKWILSGDYKSATDFIHPDLCRAAVRTIVESSQIPEDLGEIYLDGLVGAWIVPGPSSEEQFQGVRQTWGQLMGSPYSFPILCIINAAVNRYFYELSEGCQIKLKDMPMIINGDDLLLRCNRDHYSDWKAMLSDAGLEFSMGKNYLSNKFAVINSTYYEYVDTLWGPRFYSRAYCNLSLCHPSWDIFREKIDVRMGEVSLDPEAADLASVSRDLVDGHVYDDHDFLISQFLGDPLVKKILGGVKPGVSYFAHKSLGGIGIYTPRRGVFTPEQLGYYTRVAGTRGELAPLWPALGCHGKDNSGLYDTIDMETCAEDWFLPADVIKADDVTTAHYFRALLTWVTKFRKTYQVGYKPIRDRYPDPYLARAGEAQNVQEVDNLLGESKRVRLWGGYPVSIEGMARLCHKMKITFFTGRKTFTPSIVDRKYYRPHVAPWAEQDLMNYPWIRVAIRRVRNQERPLVVSN